MLDTQPFGATGHTSSRVIFGAAAFGACKPETVERFLPLLEEFGVNHIDVAASYGDAEVRLAPLLARDRSKYFLATKTGDRSGDAARASLERSLERMGVDQVDLIQLHNLVEEDEWREAFSPGGAVEALFAARDEGLVRHVGITGHGLRIPVMHQRSLAEAPFESVLVPFNHSLLAIDSYRADVEALLGLCADRNVAVQTIKSVARRRWPQNHQGLRASWYQPLPEGPALDRAVGFVLHHPQLFLNTSSDLRLLRPTLRAATQAQSEPTASLDHEALAADREANAIKPLFDGSELERI